MVGVTEIRMAEIVEKFRRIEKELSAEKGLFTLFALVEREDSQLGSWDVVISADWIGNNEKQALNIITSKIYAKLTKTEQVILSRIVILAPSDPFVQNLNFTVPKNGDSEIITNATINGILIKKAYLITSNSTAIHFPKRVLKANERLSK